MAATPQIGELERKLHQAILATPDKIMDQKAAMKVIPNATEFKNVTNVLLKAGWVKALKDAKGKILLRAVQKDEHELRQGLSSQDALVYSHIEASGNQGIWTKHIKSKTDFHQSIVDRSIKNLLQKGYIKPITSVQHKTRKMYILANLEPSEELTGGPWYSGSELDTEFIKQVTAAILLFIRDKSFPKRKGVSADPDDPPLFAISAGAHYPNAAQVKAFVERSGVITNVNLRLADIQTLLAVLVADGEIEEIPAYAGAMWSVQDVQDDDEGESDDDDRSSRKSKKKRKKSSKRIMDDEDSDHRGSSSRKKKRRDVSDSSDSSDSGSGSDTRRRSRKKLRSDAADSQLGDEIFDASIWDENVEAATTYGGGTVFRAIRQERLNWGFTQAPCTLCPQATFCSTDGPVNPRECTYYGTFIKSDAIDF